MRKTSRRADTEEDLSHHRAPLNNMLLTATLNLAPALRPRAAKKPAAKRGSLQVVAHGGVGGSGGTQYPGKDKPHGSDQAPWRKKLITHDPDQADPDANSGRGGGWTPPPPQQESFAAAAPSSGGSSWDAPAPSSGGSSWDAPAPSSGGSSWDAPAPSSGGSSWDKPAAPAPSYGGGGNRGGRSDKVIVKGGITYDPDQYDPNP